MTSAASRIASPVGVIDVGTVAAQRFTWEGTVDGEPVITVRTNWFMGEQDLDPGWTFGSEGERFEVEVTGDPSSLVTFHGWHPVSIEAGHYESFYLKACHPAEPLGAWIRYTVHKRPGAAAKGSLWFTLLEPSGPTAAKRTVPDPASGGRRRRPRAIPPP